MKRLRLIPACLKAVARALAWLARSIYNPWRNKEIIREVETQMHFWHRIENEALANARHWEKKGNAARMFQYLDQARTASLRCEKEMSRLPYNKRPETSNHENPCP